MPLVLVPGPERDLSERQRIARKVKPQYSEGRLVTVAHARNQPEAELIQGLLLEEGIPSMARRTAGFDVPDFLAAGPRDILVPQSGVEAAREALSASPAD
jgi:predicted esterase